MLKKRKKYYKLEKAIIQIAFFFLMPSAFSAGFTGVKNIFQWIGSGQMLQLNTFVIAFICLCVFTIIFGRFFCGYLCAFGSMGDLFGFLSEIVQKKLMKRKKKFSFPVKVVLGLQKLKYVNLVFIVLVCAKGLYSNLSGNSAWDVFSILTGYSPLPEGYMVGLLCLIAVIVGSVLHDRFFCQFLCPLGAVFSLLPVIPLFRIRRNSKNCIKGCKACTMMCPAHVRLESDSFRSGECIGCGRCKYVCAKGNIKYIEEKKMNPFVSVIIRAALFFVMGCFIGMCRVSF